MCNSCVSIELLPEFGWSIQNKNVFGPGSVFQGFVTIKNSNADQHNVLLQAERIKVIFSSAETIQPYTVSPGIVRSSKKSIFAVQKTIWDNKSLEITPIKSEYTFPFTVQLPMIQYPPSMNHRVYKTEYKLAAIVNMVENGSTSSTFLRSETSILYMPLIETSILKTPLIVNTTTKDKEISAKLKLGAQEYVSGDFVDIELTLNAILNTSKKSNPALKNVNVIIELHQTLKVLAFDDVPDQVKVVASGSHKLSMEIKYDPVSPTYSCVAGVGLFVPIDLPPSFQGKLTSISYALHIRVQQKTALGGIWKRESQIETIPITIGTLGYGIRSSSSLINYSNWSNTNQSAATNEESEEMPVPRFMRHIEYEEALPKYESSNLPPYCESATPPTIEGA